MGTAFISLLLSIINLLCKFCEFVCGNASLMSTCISLCMSLSVCLCLPNSLSLCLCLSNWQTSVFVGVQKYAEIETDA